MIIYRCRLLFKLLVAFLAQMYASVERMMIANETHELAVAADRSHVQTPNLRDFIDF